MSAQICWKKAGSQSSDDFVSQLPSSMTDLARKLERARCAIVRARALIGDEVSHLYDRTMLPRSSNIGQTLGG